MIDDQTENGSKIVPVDEAPYRNVQFGKIYDKLEPNKAIDISAFGGDSIIIDEENLGLEKVTLENLQKAWESGKEQWVKQCTELGIEIDPFEVFKYYHIQRKAFEILGKPIPDQHLRKQKQIAERHKVKLSEMKGLAMCSEYAVLTTYISQRLGDDVSLVVGATADDDGTDKPWRESHAYGLNNKLNVVYDGSLVQTPNEYPAILVPETQGKMFDVLEKGFDVNARRIGTPFTRVYGLEAGGFGTRIIATKPPITLQQVARRN